MREIVHCRVLALDAMGVLYQAGDDVAELLVPFIRTRGGESQVERIEHAYLSASLGEISARQFWRDMGLDPAVEDEYLSQHKLQPRVVEAIQMARGRFDHICCLSNDVSEWSVKLRQRFGLDDMLDSWHISGDLRMRKPQSSIYRELVSSLGVSPAQVLFIDDRPKNLDAARLVGILTALFGGQPIPGHLHFSSFSDETWRSIVV